MRFTVELKNINDLDQQIGTWKERQAWTARVAKGLESLIPDAKILFRAKENKSILEKMSRFGESVKEVHDLFGLRVIVKDFDAVEKVTDAVVREFGRTPTDQEMTIRHGTLVFVPLRNYRKRDWVGVSPASSGGYNDAIHLNRVYQDKMIELQILTQDLFDRYCSQTADESHDLFKQRQAKLYKKTSLVKS